MGDTKNGSWNANQLGGYIRRQAAINPQEAWSYDTGDDGGVVYLEDSGTIATVSDELTGWESRGQLIAAAPDLLAALRAWVEAEQEAHFEEQAHDADGCRYCESVAAIARAEGTVQS